MRRIFTLIIGMLMFIPVFAQNKHERTEDHSRMIQEYREYKMKLIAQELDLKGETRNKFFETYQQMCNERGPVMHKLGEARRKIKYQKNLSEEEYEQINRQMTECRDEAANIEKKYFEKFGTFLTQKQIYEMKTVEDRIHTKAKELKKKKAPKK